VTLPADAQRPPRQMTLTALANLPAVAAGDDIGLLVIDAVAHHSLAVREGDVFVIAQKIVSKSENRWRYLRDVEPSARAHQLAAIAGKDPRVVELILAESVEVIRCVPGVIVVEHRLGLVMANAGIDASNTDRSESDEAVLLLPQSPDQSASAIRHRLEQHFGCALGVIINDSFGRAWRMGTIGTAIGISGVPGLDDLRGRPDRGGRLLRHSELAVADELAAAASLLMGQADESLPVVHATGIPYALRESCADELIRARNADLFR
jgi:coenzyme F420-0:L-glutamate ligase/coenzyme F420-1:gamma-L-glutamate ligase